MTVWKERISILLLEDDPGDVELLSLILKRSSLKYIIEAVFTKEEFEVLFKSKNFDIVITDYNLQGYDGQAAIKWVRSIDPILPIILLSDTVGEEMAVDLLRAGANDFVLKSNLKKITIAMERALSEARMENEKLRFQKELVEKNLILDTVFDNFEDMIFLKDANGKYLKVNRAFCDFLEVREEEVIGKVESEIFSPEISQKAMENDEFVILTGKKVSYEFDHVDSQGKRTVVEVIKIPLHDGDRVTGIVGEGRNITKQKLLIESKEKTRQILTQAEQLTGSGSFEYDSDLDVLNCSNNFKRMMNLNVEGDNISLRKFTQLIKEEDRYIFMKGMSESIGNRTEYYMQHRFNKDDGERHFKVLFRPDYRDVKGSKFYGTIVDITAEHENHIYVMQKQEEDRKEIARELHDNLGQKLNAVSMYVSKMSNDDPSNKNMLKVKNIVHESIDDLGSLINNISVKQVEEHSLDYALTKLFEHLPETLDVKSCVEISEDKISPFVKAQVFRVIQEVLNNVSKYSEATSLKMDMKQEGSILNFLIEDNGKGFEIESGKKGNGLKNIVHRIKMSNGLISIDSAPGKGTSVKVKIPIA